MNNSKTKRKCPHCYNDLSATTENCDRCGRSLGIPKAELETGILGKVFNLLKRRKSFSR